jgi:hypothetical protein
MKPLVRRNSCLNAENLRLFVRSYSGLIVDTDDVRSCVSGVGKPGVGQKSSGHGIGGKLMRRGAFEADDSLALALTIINLKEETGI